MRVRIDYPPSEAVFRQTPGGAGVWAEVTFLDGSSTGRVPVDAWVVFERMAEPAAAVCDPARTVFLAGEPPSVRPYDPRFLAQFAVVVAPGHALDHPGAIRHHAAIPWWAGMVLSSQPHKTVASHRLGYDQFKAMGIPEKTRPLSVLCSDRALTEGHRQRLQLVERLRSHFGDRLEVFGHGFRPVADKWEAIAPYRYHVVIENNRVPHYWTEKLADAYLAGAFPIYCGCPNVGDYFPAGSFRAIDRGDPAGAIATIEGLLSADAYSTALPALRLAKDLVLDRHNLFPMLAELVRGLPRGERRRVFLRPERDFSDRFATRAKRGLKRKLERFAPRWLNP